MATPKVQNEAGFFVTPSVSREKWAQHALHKLTKGYALVVGTERRNASFFKPGNGYTMCAYKTAQQLIREGLVVKAGPHALGTLYLLAPKVVLPDLAPPLPDEDEDGIDTPTQDPDAFEATVNLLSNLEAITEDIEDPLAGLHDHI